MSRVTDAIDDVVTLINAATLTQTVTAVRKHIYNLTTEHSNNLSLVVMPVTRTAENEARNSTVETHEIDLVFRKPAAVRTNTEVDSLLTFVDEVIDLVNRAILTTSGTKVVGYSQEGYFDGAELHEAGTFLATVTLSIRDQF